MSQEILLQPESLTITTKERVEKIKADEEKFAAYYEYMVDFADELRAECSARFPDEPNAWISVSDWHLMIGSSIREDLAKNVSLEVEAFIQDRIAGFLDTFEKEYRS